MKYMREFIAILCFFAFFCGCQEVPEEVRENMEQYGDNPQLKSSDLEYYTLEELKKAKIPEIDTGSLKLPSTVDFSRIEDVGLLQLSCYDDFQKDSNVEKYASLFNADKSRFTNEEATVLGDHVYYEDETEQKYVSLMQNGGLVYMEKTAFEDTDSTIQRAYSLAQDDISEVTVQLAGREASLSEICGNTEEWINENMPIEGIRQKITDVVIRKLGNAKEDARRISMCAEYDYKGIHFNNHTLGRSEEKDFQTNMLTTFLFTQLAFDNSDFPIFFSRNEGFQIDQMEPLGQIVTFESAVRLLSETLSGFGTFDISEILPLYDVFPDFQAPAAGRKMAARPVYAFLVEMAETGDGTELGIVKPNRCKYFFFVDMATGELTTNLKIEREG